MKRAMPQLRQLVIAAEDPRRLAAFYQAVFELQQVEASQEALFLSDGIFNLALVAEADAAKQGFRHMSFDTTRAETIGKKLAHVDMPESNLREVNSVAGIDHELRDPDGNTVGISRRAFDVAC